MNRAAPLLALLACLGVALLWAGTPRAAEGESAYESAAADFHRLEQQATPSADAWRTLAQQFRAIYTAAPKGHRGADALYSAGLAYRRAWQVSVEWRDLSRAVAQFREFSRRYAHNRLADDALMHLAALQTDGFSDLSAACDTYRHLLASYPHGDQHTVAARRLASLQAILAARNAPVPEPAEAIAQTDAPGTDGTAPATHGTGLATARPNAAAAPTPALAVATPATATDPAAAATPAIQQGSAAGGNAMPTLAAMLGAAPADRTAGASGTADAHSAHEVREVEHWSTPDLTRVILTTDPDVPYTVNHIPPRQGHLERLYLDLRGQPSDTLQAGSADSVGLLRAIRIGRHNADTTRVVMDLAGLKHYTVKTYRLPTENKIVIDLQPRPAVAAATRRRLTARLVAQQGPPPQPHPALGALPPDPLANVPAGLRIHAIMIDPGHGGHDPGALGFGLEEKNLTLQIGRDLRDLFRRRDPALRVGMTRDSDVFIPLQERPEIARRFGANLFVSIHVNANPIHRFHGVETYFLNLTNDRHALQVAARENETSEQGTNELNDILRDLMRDTTLIESSDLAKTVQASLVSTLREDRGPVRDLGVKQAPFLVLMGSEMPSVLVEVGFITNRSESQRLRDPHYLEQIAEGIYDGLGRYIHQQNIVAARRGPPSIAANAQP